MIEVPVLLNFDHDRPIGYMKIDEKQLPKNVDFVFSIGYAVKNMQIIDDEFIIKSYDLMCVALQTDKEYQEYLEMHGG